jgi:hypothetical protein
MTKYLSAVLLATVLWAPQAAGQSILQKSDRRGTNFETYLPAVGTSVPWLNLDTRMKLPKGDLPIGRQAGETGPLVLRTVTPERQVSSNVPSVFRRMLPWRT